VCGRGEPGSARAAACHSRCGLVCAPFLPVEDSEIVMRGVVLGSYGRHMRELLTRARVIFFQEPDGGKQLLRRQMVRRYRQGRVQRLHGIVYVARPVIAKGEIEARQAVVPVFRQHLLELADCLGQAPGVGQADGPAVAVIQGQPILGIRTRGGSRRRAAQVPERTEGRHDRQAPRFPGRPAFAVRNRKKPGPQLAGLRRVLLITILLFPGVACEVV